MRRKLLKSLINAGLVLIMFVTSTLACGPFTMEAIFVYTVHPAYPLDRFAKGEMGVIQPTYARSYLYAAYRHLSGESFSAAEQKALTELWTDRLEQRWELGDIEWVKSWLEARQKVSGLPESPKIEVYRSREKPNEYDSYLNCQKDSFVTAISTLNERIAKYSADSPVVRAWIDAQDQVFANCSEGRHIPTPATADSDALTKADRSYQIAAANFYSTNLDEARSDFQAIAADSASPWQRQASYLVARTFIRKASLGPAEGKQEALNEAEKQLRQILADARLNGLHAQSQKLLDLVRLRAHPAERMHELARKLVAKSENKDLKQDLWDYTVLLDGYLETDEPAKKNQFNDELRRDDLTDWISTLQASGDEPRAHAYERWQTTSALPWLIAALSKTSGKDVNASKLISAAMNIAAKSPAFPGARFHAARLLIEAGNLNEAGTLVDDLMTKNRAQLDESTLNLVTGQKMLLATTLADFLKSAPRTPAGLSWNDDGREIPAQSSDSSEGAQNLFGKPLFDEDAAEVINRRLPLVVLKEASSSTSLPVHLRRDLVQAVWLRAVLLGDMKTADELVPVLKTLVPKMGSLLDEFLATTQPEQKKYVGLFVWLKTPGLEPIVNSGIGREAPLEKQDTYRDNWWCEASFATVPNALTEEVFSADAFTSKTKATPVFVTPDMLSNGTRQYESLLKLGTAPNFLCRQMIEWATKNPGDPRLPEALHLAVVSTRFGCTDKETGRLSKAAFDVLHRKYPNTTWAKKTPYWFKD